ncbi:MAG TPA: hypothetical protein VFX85_09355 [Solirubrobacterales bacterium]|nr:hypothetical protein [Solirubrobacterales bacterium]
MGGESSETAVGIALAEFNALRAEIISHITAQTAVVTLGVTALGILVGLVAKEGADDHLLLVVPPVSMFVILLLTAENYRIWRIGDYIRNHLWPFLQAQAGPVPSWEAEVIRYRSSRGIFFKAAAIDSPAIILFIVASVASLAWIRDPGDGLWWAGCAMTATAIGAPIAVALSSRSNSLRPG